MSGSGKGRDVPAALRTVHGPGQTANSGYASMRDGTMSDDASVICGAVSQYNATGPVTGPSNYLALLVYRASMIGMVVFDYAARFGEATAALAGWLGEGRLISREHIVEGGVSAFPDALLKLFSGENTGKLIVKVAE